MVLIYQYLFLNTFDYTCNDNNTYYLSINEKKKEKKDRNFTIFFLITTKTTINGIHIETHDITKNSFKNLKFDYF